MLSQPGNAPPLAFLALAPSKLTGLVTMPNGEAPPPCDFARIGAALAARAAPIPAANKTRSAASSAAAIRALSSAAFWPIHRVATAPSPGSISGQLHAPASGTSDCSRRPEASVLRTL